MIQRKKIARRQLSQLNKVLLTLSHSSAFSVSNSSTNKRAVGTIFNSAYEIIIRTSILSLWLLLLAAFVTELNDDKWVMSNFELPDTLKTLGYTNRGVAERILFEMQTIRQQSAFLGGFDYKKVDTDLVETQLSVGEFNITALFAFFKKFCGKHDRQIGGFVQSSHNQQKLTLRINEDFPISKSASSGEFDSLLVWASEEIMKRVDPMNLGNYYVIKDSLHKANQIVTYLKNQTTIRSREKALFLQARIFRKGRKYTEVTKVIDELLNINPGHGGGYLIQANNYYAQWEADRDGSVKLSLSDKEMLKKKAIFCLQEIINRNLTDPEAEESMDSKTVHNYIKGASYLVWALFETSPSNPKRVRELIDKGLEISAVSTNYNNAANSLLLTGDLEQAEIYTNKAIELDPTDGIFWDTYADVMVRQNKFDEAITGLENVFRNTSSIDLNVESYLTDDRFKPILNDVRFKALIQKYIDQTARKK